MSAEYTTTTTTYSNRPGEVNLVAPPAPPPKDNDTTLPSLGLDIPLSPVSPSPVSSAVEKTRKYSPLADLIESEKAYVEILTGVIRNVAAAWSRSNLPPPQLDLMFRSVEGVYKSNRTLLTRLKEIGENPSSPKALGDLLMRWIDELEQPYMTYADRYCIGFDDWEHVKSNSKLPTILQNFSVSNPPPSALPRPTRLLNPLLWTLDALFLLPKGRLQYYRKLYSRLLKSMTPGRSDHKLLTGALVKLDNLLATLDEKTNTIVGIPQPSQIPLLPHLNTEGNSNVPSTNELMENGVLLSGHFGADSASAAPSIRGSFSSRDERLSQGTASTSFSRESAQTLSSPVLDLERRMTTENTLDIFTMQPKQIRLQIAPPTLPYTRELRLSVKALVRFTPKATGVEVVHHHGYVFILSDLFLLCEEMTLEERVARGEDGRDIRLCYPPLSGKVLNVAEVPRQENVLRVSIMRKETLIMETESRLKRDRMLNEFQECISFAKTISRAVQEPVPPLPPIDNIPRSPATLKTSGGSLRARPERALNPRLLLQSQPVNFQSERTDDATFTVDRAPAVALPKRNDDMLSMSLARSPPRQQNIALTQHETTQHPRHNEFNSPLSSPSSPGNGRRLPVVHNSGPICPPRTSSSGYATNSPPSSFVPGQIIPPIRSASVQSQSPPSMMATSGLPGGSHRVYSPPTVQDPAPQNSILRHHASMHSLRQQSLQYQPSVQPLPHRPNHQNVAAAAAAPPPHSMPGPHSSNGGLYPTHPSSPTVTSSPVEQPPHRLRKSLSSRSLHVQYQHSQTPPPPIPSLPDGLPTPQHPHSQRKNSVGSLNMPMSRTLLPSMQMGSRTNSVSEPSILDPSPPVSPAEERKPLGPVRSVVTAQMKCKVFLQQQHAQWKPMGSANLTLYRQEPTNVKQLVVETGSKERSVLISTIVLTDGVERVGKTGVAIELSDAGGARTGVIYMIQLRNEESASGLFKNLLAGSDRTA